PPVTASRGTGGTGTTPWGVRHVTGDEDGGGQEPARAAAGTAETDHDRGSGSDRPTATRSHALCHTVCPLATARSPRSQRARPSRRGTGSGGPRNLRRPHRVRYAASTRPVRRLSAAGLGRSAAAGLPQRVDELLLAHGGAAGDVQLPGAFVEVLFAGVGVHS